MYRSLQLIIKENFWAISLPLFLFTSPVFAYYGVSFLTDIPSIAFRMVGECANRSWDFGVCTALVHAFGNSRLLLGAMVVIFLSTLIPLIFFLKERYGDILQSKKLRIIFLSFLLVNLVYCGSMMSLKKFAQDGVYPAVGNHETVKLLRWFNFNHQTNIMRYDRMKPYLDEIGISENDKVITMNDETFNATLFLMNRKGLTGFVPLNEDLMHDYIDHGADYLFIDNPETLKLDFIQPFIQNPVGNFENVHICSLQNINGDEGDQ